MKLIYIRSTMEPKNYSTIRSILKKEQSEKIAPYIFKINDTQTLEAYLRKEKITYEIYQEERKIINVKKRKQNESVQLLLLSSFVAACPIFYINNNTLDSQY